MGESVRGTPWTSPLCPGGGGEGQVGQGTICSVTPAYLLFLVQALCVLTLRKCAAGFSRFALPELVAPARHLRLPATFCMYHLCHQFGDNCCCSVDNIGVVPDCVISFCPCFLFLSTLVFGLWEPPDATGNSVSDAECAPSSTSVCVSFQWFHNLMAFSFFVPIDTRLRLFNSSSSVSPDRAKYS